MKKKKTEPFLSFKYIYSRNTGDSTINVSFEKYKETIICYLTVYRSTDNTYLTEIKGLARLHPDDTFDIEEGIRISFQYALKALESYYNQLVRDYTEALLGNPKKKTKGEKQVVLEGLTKKLWRIYDNNENKFIELESKEAIK